MYTAYIKEMTEKVIQFKQFVAQVSSPASATPATGSAPHDSVLAVVDTAAGKVDPYASKAGENQLVVKKDFKTLSSAIVNLQTVYKGVDIRAKPSSFKLNK